jgi:hypothetical protein
MHFCICSILISDAQRLNRFLNSKVANRITVLERSHNSHREDTSSTRNIFFGAFTTVSLIIFVIAVIVIFIFRRLRRIVRERQTPTLDALQASGLPSIHPMTSVLFHTLQRLNTIEQHHRDHPVSPFSPPMSTAMGLHFNSPSSNVLKF